MKYITSTKDFQLEGTAVALGKFDGIHRGHQILLNTILKEKKNNYAATMFTFDYHPANLFRETEINLIYTPYERRRIVEAMGIDVLIEYPFTSETAKLMPEDFVKEVLIGNINAKVIVVGEDFQFGYKRQGNVNLLKKLAAELGFQLIVCEKIKYNNRDISSTYIREMITKGDITAANEMLGSPISIYGEVVHGLQNGRKMGYKTANQIPNPMKLLPPNGVYVSRIELDGKEYKGITNIGSKPTIGSDFAKTVETNIFSFDQDIYGEMLTISLLQYKRPEQKFESMEELKNQLYQDVEYGEKFFRQKREDEYEKIYRTSRKK